MAVSDWRQKQSNSFGSPFQQVNHQRRSAEGAIMKTFLRHPLANKDPLRTDLVSLLFSRVLLSSRLFLTFECLIVG